MGRLSLPLLALGLLAHAPVARAAADYPAADPRPLLEEASAAWDLSQQDAVLLREEARHVQLADGRWREERRRVVWIRTHWALGVFADLRLPWDSARQTFTVGALRVWRDGRWIEGRPTAVVETTPFALRDAPDYASVRETMLLHDGIELPCVLECAYALEDLAPPRGGREGLWAFRHVVPALESRLTIETPAGAPLRALPAGGAPAARPEPAGGEPGRTVLTFAMRRTEAAPLFAADPPEADLPRVAWSSFADWPALGQAVAAGLDGGDELDAALVDSLEALRVGGPPIAELAGRVAAFVARAHRHVHYPARVLPPAARPVARIHDTAYGGDLDLAALAAALLRRAGCRVWPALVGRGHGSIDGEPPSLALLRAPGLWLEADGLAAYWDAATGHLHHGGGFLSGRTLWRIGLDERPAVWPPGGDGGGRLDLSVLLRWDAAAKRWTGSGYLEAAGACSPYDQMAGPGGAAQAELDRMISGVLAGMATQSYGPRAFAPTAVGLHFDLRPAAAARDTLGRLPLAIGAPAGGPLSLVPGDWKLHLPAREAAARLPGPLAQTIKIDVDLGGLESVRLPAPVQISNAAGSFRLEAARAGERLSITRALRLDRARYEPADWPALRALLLAESGSAGRLVLLR